MGVLTKEQLDQVWHENGLKYRVGRFHGWLAEHNLLAYITERKIVEHLYEVLEAFFVKGIKETKDGRQIAAAGEHAEPGDTESQDR